MFISSHDLILLTLLLLFAMAISLPVALVTARILAERVRLVSLAAQQMAAGHLNTRVPVAGNDELGRLAGAFNLMATRVEDANRKQAEEERSRRDLIAAISHDLRTPLSSIRVMVEAIQDGLVDADTTAVYLEQILDETQGLSLLIDDLFELSHIESGSLRLDLEHYQPSHLVEDAIDTMLPKAQQRGIRLERAPEPDTGLVLADSGKIQRVFYNLLDNALRYTPPGGAVRLETDDQGPDVLFSVTDSGGGIRAQDLPHVFERFYRGDKARSDSGAGLGLAIARGIVEAHGGRIWVESQPNLGACFSFTLPKSRDGMALPALQL